MLSSTRLLSLALLLLSALNAAAAPTGTPPNVPTNVPTNVPANVPTNVPANVPADVVPPPADKSKKTKGKGKAKDTGASAPIAGGSGSNQPVRLPAPPKRPVALADQPKCASCITAGGHWDKVTFTCARVSATNTLNKVTSATGCAQMLQMQTVFPAASSTARAGLIPQTFITQFEGMRGHIFQGEAADADSGRHILSSFLAKHAGLTPTVQDAATKIQLFRFVGGDSTNKIKTVWDDGTNAYKAIDVKNMCVTAGKILSNAGQTGPQKGAVVVSPFGTNTCITFAHQGSKGTCFPLGVNTTSALGTICTQQ